MSVLAYASLSWLLTLVQHAAFSTLLAWRPFYDPLPLSGWYGLLLIPLVVGVSFAYKAIKVQNTSQIARESLLLCGQILAFMVVAAIVLWTMTRYW